MKKWAVNMKAKWNKYWSKIWFKLLIIAIGVLVVVGLLYCAGLRITYAPELENNWDSISAYAAWFSVVVSIVGVGASFAAVWYAIRVADKQNKIALFEKRYAIYREINRCHTFGFIVKFTENSDEGRKAFLTSFEKESLVDVDQTKINTETDMNWNLKVLMRVQKLLETLRQSKFLFADEPCIFKYTEEIATAITILVAPISMNDKEFGQARKKFIDLMNDEMYNKVLDKMEKELQVKNK